MPLTTMITYDDECHLAIAPVLVGAVKRDVPDRSKGSEIGYVLCPRTNTALKSESGIEHNTIFVLYGDRDIERVLPQSARINHVNDNGKTVTHTIDLRARRWDHYVYGLLCKGDSKATHIDQRHETRQLAAITPKSVADELNFITDRDLPAYEVENARLMLSCRREDRDEIDAALVALAPIPSDLFQAFIMGTPALVVRSGKRPEILIDRAAADALFIGLAPFLNRLQLQDLLGRHHLGRHDHVEMLVKAGVLNGPLKHEALEGHEETYSLPQVVREVAAFVEPFRRVPAKPADLVSLGAATSRTKVPIAKLLGLLVQRQLVKVAILEGAAFMDALHVDPEEILEVLAGVESPMSKRAASAYLGVNGLALSSLIEQGWLIPGGARQDGMLKDVFSKSQLDEFMSRYARPREAYALTSARSATELRSKGLDPAILIDLESKGRGNFILYDRQEISAFLERSTA